MFRKAFLGLFAVVTISIAACKEDVSAYDCTDTIPTYTADIKPIFDAECATSGCHSASSREAGVDLSNYTGSKAASGSDDLLGTIEHLNGYPAMPQGSAKLADSLIQKIYCWVNNGTPQ